MLNSLTNRIEYADSSPSSPQSFKTTAALNPTAFKNKIPAPNGTTNEPQA